MEWSQSPRPKPVVLASLVAVGLKRLFREGDIYSGGHFDLPQVQLLWASSSNCGKFEVSFAPHY